MNCSRHHSSVAVGNCPECGQPLCSDCFDYTNGHLCYDCCVESLNSTKKLRNKILVFGFLFGLLFGVLLGILVGTAGDVPNVSAGIGIGIFAFFGGFAFGEAILFSKNQKKPAITIISLAIFSLLTGPVFFIIYLVRLIKLTKGIKAIQETVDNYPN